jgi:triosephosphate isomerase (TIM)
MLARPVVIVNLKTYRESTGEGALRIARAALKVQEETGAGMAIAAQAADLRLLKEVGVPLYAQHFEPVPPGQHTGYDLAHALHAAMLPATPKTIVFPER